MLGDHYLKGKEYLEKERYNVAIEYLGIAAWLEEKEGNVEEAAIAKRDLARAHLMLNDLDAAYERFSDLILVTNNRSIIEFSIAMISVIYAKQGFYEKSLRMVSQLPETPRNLINKAILYFELHIHDNIPGALNKAEEIILKVDLNSPDMMSNRLLTIYNTYALIYHQKGEYEKAEAFFNKALELSTSKVFSGKIYNGMGELFLDSGNLEMAEKNLYKARNYLEGQDIVSEAWNAKYLGRLEREKKNFDAARLYLLKAAQIMKDKGLYKELAEICVLLSDSYLGVDQTLCAEYLAESIIFERKSKEVTIIDEKIYRIIDAFFNDDNSNQSSR